MSALLLFCNSYPKYIINIRFTKRLFKTLFSCRINSFAYQNRRVPYFQRMSVGRYKSFILRLGRQIRNTACFFGRKTDILRSCTTASAENRYSTFCNFQHHIRKGFCVNIINGSPAGRSGNTCIRLYNDRYRGIFYKLIYNGKHLLRTERTIYPDGVSMKSLKHCNHRLRRGSRHKLMG